MTPSMDLADQALKAAREDHQRNIDEMKACFHVDYVYNFSLDALIQAGKLAQLDSGEIVLVKGSKTPTVVTREDDTYLKYTDFFGFKDLERQGILDHVVSITSDEKEYCCAVKCIKETVYDDKMYQIALEFTNRSKFISCRNSVRYSWKLLQDAQKRYDDTVRELANLSVKPEYIFTCCKFEEAKERLKELLELLHNQ